MVPNETIILQDICRKELDFGLYDIKIDDVSVYFFIRRYVRECLLREKGVVVMHGTTPRKHLAIIGSAFVSLFQLGRLFLGSHKYPTLFVSFPRIDKIGDLYVDKFTDPLIAQCFKREEYLIYEHGLGGYHQKNRDHKDQILYAEAVDVYREMLTSLFYRCFVKRHSESFDQLVSRLKEAFGKEFGRLELGRMVYSFLVSVRCKRALLRHLSAERVIGPSRDYLIDYTVAAHQTHLKVFELQHGVTYGESVMYSGYHDELFTPDAFLSFGHNKPSDVYGIGEDRMAVIGWAFQDYIAHLPHKETYGEKDVLVISDPEVTESIFRAVVYLADRNPSTTFFIRPHPHEQISEQQMDLIRHYGNIRIQDKRINIAVVLQGFRHVVGENSTVLYEALAVNKKVGRLYFEGLNPKYLEESDRECFWEIHNQSEFEAFLASDVSARKSKSIYAPFDKDLFEKVVGLPS